MVSNPSASSRGGSLFSFFIVPIAIHDEARAAIATAAAAIVSKTIVHGGILRLLFGWMWLGRLGFHHLGP